MSTCCLSRRKVLNLHVHTPQWRLTVLLRLITIVISIVAIIAFALTVTSQALHNSGHGWRWGNQWIEAFSFLTPLLSILAAISSIAYLLKTTRRIHPSVDLCIELTICLINVVPISFCASAAGPLQWRQDRSDMPADARQAAIWELVGLSALTVLEILHFAFFAGAVHRLLIRRSLAGWAPSDRDTVITEYAKHEMWLPSSESSEVGTTVVDSFGKASVKCSPIMSRKPSIGESLGDPDLPKPLRVKGSVKKKLHKYGNSWSIVDVPSPRESDQGW